MWNKKIFVPFILAMIVCVYGIWQYFYRLPPSIGGTEGSVSPSDQVTNVPSDQAPDFSLKDINGSRFTLIQFQGKIVIVHFMAVGCGGQIRAITDHQLKQLKIVCDNHCGNNNFTMITVVVSTCERNTLDLIRTFYNITWVFGNDYDDKKLEIVDAYEKYSILDGSIILIDKSLRVAEVYNEEIDAGSLSTTISKF